MKIPDWSFWGTYKALYKNVAKPMEGHTKTQILFLVAFFLFIFLPVVGPQGWACLLPFAVLAIVRYVYRNHRFW